MKDKILEKYFNYDSFVFNIKMDIIDKGKYFIDKLLIDTQEREYSINGVAVTEQDFFKDIPNQRAYFSNHTWMTSGCTHYKKNYRNTLTLEECIDKYKETLDEVDLFILGNPDSYRFCHSDHNGCYLIPNTEWKVVE